MGRGRVSIQPIFSHVQGTHMSYSYRFKQTNELGSGDKGMHSYTVPVTGMIWFTIISVQGLWRRVPKKLLSLLSLEGNHLVSKT
jgi:hypothetical protein